MTRRRLSSVSAFTFVAALLFALGISPLLSLRPTKSVTIPKAQPAAVVVGDLTTTSAQPLLPTTDAHVEPTTTTAVDTTQPPADSTTSTPPPKSSLRTPSKSAEQTPRPVATQPPPTSPPATQPPHTAVASPAAPGERVLTEDDPYVWAE